MQALELVVTAADDESTDDEIPPAIRTNWDTEAMMLLMEELTLDPLPDNIIDTDRDPRINATHLPAAVGKAVASHLTTLNENHLATDHTAHDTKNDTSEAVTVDWPACELERSERLKSVGPSQE